MVTFGKMLNNAVSSLADNSESVWDFANETSEVILGELNTTIAPTEYEVVYQQDRVKLKYYKSNAKIKMKTPLLIVYALINRETMLDLQPGVSVVNSLLESGADIYMVEWGYPTKKDRYMTIGDHVNGYLNDIVDFILDREKILKLNLMGICMGGSFSVMYAALNPEKIQNIITTVTPTNFDTDQGLLHEWLKSMDVDRMMDTMGNMPGDLMNFGFLLLNPARLMIDKYQQFSKNMNSKSYVENFVRMEKWIFDSPDVPCETFRQFIKDCYQGNKLIKNEMELDGKIVNLKKLTMPLLNIYGKFDHLVPPAACEQLTTAVGSSDVEDLCLATGHIGIYVSSKCQKEFAPKIADWLWQRDEEPVVKTSKKMPKNSIAETRQSESEKSIIH